MECEDFQSIPLEKENDSVEEQELPRPGSQVSKQGKLTFPVMMGLSLQGVKELQANSLANISNMIGKSTSEAKNGQHTELLQSIVKHLTQQVSELEHCKEKNERTIRDTMWLLRRAESERDSFYAKANEAEKKVDTLIQSEEQKMDEISRLRDEVKRVQKERELTVENSKCILHDLSKSKKELVETKEYLTKSQFQRVELQAEIAEMEARLAMLSGCTNRCSSRMTDEPMSNVGAHDEIESGSSDGESDEEACQKALPTIDENRAKEWLPDWLEVDKWTPECTSHPVPQFSLDDPVVLHLISCWTQDLKHSKAAKVDRVAYLRKWLTVVGSGDLPEQFPMSLQIRALRPEIKDGFLCLIVPIIRKSSEPRLRISASSRTDPQNDGRVVLKLNVIKAQQFRFKRSSSTPPMQRRFS